MLNSTDKFLVNDGSVTETVTWETIQLEIDPLIVTVTISPDEPEVNDVVSATPVVTGGSSPYSYTYQWVLADDVDGLNQANIPGATTSTYTPVSSNKDKFLGCVVTATDTTGKSESATGYASNAVELGLVIAKPTILTPADGAGIGGDVTYTPETSAITVVDEVEGGWFETSGARTDIEYSGVAYGNGTYVAVASSGMTKKCATSTNGKQWDQYAIGTQNSMGWVDVAYGSVSGTPTFVAVGQFKGTYTELIAYSTNNGQTWTTTTNASSLGTKNNYTVTYANGKFVAIGQDFSQYSTNGSSWTEGTNVPSQNWYGLAYGNGKFVAISGDSTSTKVMYSLDGEDWSTSGITQPSSGRWSAIAYGNNKFVAVGRENKVMTSTDGLSWDIGEGAGSTQTWNSVTFANNIFVATAGTGGEYYSMWSTDGVNWQVSSGIQDGSFNDSAYGDNDGGRWVTVGNGYSHQHIYWSDTAKDASTTLTFTNDKAYDSADGTEMTTIDKAFKAGDKVVGKGTQDQGFASYVATETACFATHLYDGDGISETCITGIDNTNKALVWIKGRVAQPNMLFNTYGNPYDYLISNAPDKEVTDNPSTLTEFLSNGFKLGSATMINANNQPLVAWNFRAAPKFFDVVTYEGDGVAGKTVPHSLGTIPGMMIVKNIDRAINWVVYHKEMGATKWMFLNESQAELVSVAAWNNTEPTSSEFTVGTDGAVNSLNNNYVAYLFADTPGLIKCGGYEGTGSSKTIDLGFAPGWVLIKRTDNEAIWNIFDSKRLYSGSSTDRAGLYPNTNGAEGSNGQIPVEFVGNSFVLGAGGQTEINASGGEYIYVAIAEGAQAGEFMPTGVLTEDAAGTSMTLTDVTGEWAPGLTAVNETEATEYAPGADDIVFTSSKPVAQEGESLGWGAAEWELSVDSGFVDKQESSVFLADSNPELGPTNFTLEDDTEYWVRTRYNSADPEAISEWSESTKFQTAGTGKGWFEGNTPAHRLDYVTWGDYDNGRFVAVGDTDKKAMWSPDGIDWYLGSGIAENVWTGVAYGDGRFVAVSVGGSDQVYYSDNGGETWSNAGVTGIPNGGWNSITYGNGYFVAVAQSGSNRIMYSTDGETWVGANAPEANSWMGVTYGDGKFVAVSSDGTNRVMWTTNPSLTWNAAKATDDDDRWKSIAYGNGKFVAIAMGGWKLIMHATDPAGPWTPVEAPSFNTWFSVTYGAGKFVATAFSGNENRIMYAEDPTVPWNETASNHALVSVVYGKDRFVAVGLRNSVSGPVVIYSFTGTGDPYGTRFYDENNAEAVSDLQLERRYGLDATKTDLRKFGIYPLTEQPTYAVAAYVKENGHYRPIRDYSTEATEINQTINTTKASLETRIAALESQE